MPCTGRFAEAWSFSSFWCTGAILMGVDTSGGAANAFLTASGVDFVTFGIVTGEGMILYNTTENTSGIVTAVAPTTITATGVTWTDGDGYRIVTINAAERSTIEHYLNISASDIHAAMAASGACDCTLADWAADYLAKLNIIEAASYYQCTCAQPKLTPEQRMQMLRWATEQLVALRQGNLEVCSGATGAEFPAIAHAERGWTAETAAEIIYNRLLRES